MFNSRKLSEYEERILSRGITIEDRDHAMWLPAAARLIGKLEWAQFYGARCENHFVTKIAKQWKCDAAIIRLNCDCEWIAQHQMEMKIALQTSGCRC